eukprot:6715041-Prymnesium_polylepis.1
MASPTTLASIITDQLAAFVVTIQVDANTTARFKLEAKALDMDSFSVNSYTSYFHFTAIHEL